MNNTLLIEKDRCRIQAPENNNQAKRKSYLSEQKPINVTFGRSRTTSSSTGAHVEDIDGEDYLHDLGKPDLSKQTRGLVGTPRYLFDESRCVSEEEKSRFGSFKSGLIRFYSTLQNPVEVLTICLLPLSIYNVDRLGNTP